MLAETLSQPHAARTELGTTLGVLPHLRIITPIATKLIKTLRVSIKKLSNLKQRLARASCEP